MSVKYQIRRYKHYATIYNVYRKYWFGWRCVFGCDGIDQCRQFIYNKKNLIVEEITVP